MEKHKILTGLEIRASLFTYLKWSGVCPYVVEGLEGNSKEDINESAPTKITIKILKSGPFVLLANVFLAYWIFVTTLYSVQMLRYAFFETRQNIVMGFSSFLGSIYCGLAIQLKVRQCGDDLCHLFNRVNEIEKRIFYFYHNKTVEKIINKQQLECKYFFISSSIIIFVAVIVVSLKHLEDPTHPAYLNNFINPNDKIQLLVFSVIIGIHGQIYIWVVIAHFFTITLQISRAIYYCLEVVSFDEDLSDNNILAKLDKAVTFYHELENVMEECNDLIGWPLFLNLGASLFVSCCFAYVPLRQFNVTSMEGLLFYICAFLSLIYFFSFLYPMLGAVFEQSVEFKRSWNKRLGQNKKEFDNYRDNNFVSIKQRLKGAYPFGVQCGCFFVITKSSLLTFMSALSTYLIIMLQFNL